MKPESPRCPRIVAQGVTLSRGGRRILDGVSLEAEPGRFLAILGPNGAGKSSLLAVLSGWWTPDDGRVLLGDSDLHGLDEAARAAQLSVMRQENIRPAGLTVLEAVELGCLARGCGEDEARSIAWEMLRRMDLEDCAVRDCTRVSGGEWQRASFARAVAQLWDCGSPGVLLLDEPVSSLDPAHQHSLLAEVRRLAADGFAVVAVLHDLNLTSQYADDVVLLQDGRLRAHGAAEELMEPRILSEIYGCPVAALEDRERGLRSLVILPSGAERPR